jgi:polyisoprenyl-phosphate glycosyltransferase
VTADRAWVVVPLYHDVEAFSILRDRIKHVVAESTALRLPDVRFVVVDDSGGQDDEVYRLRSMHDVTLIEAPFNLGHQRAIVFALRSMAPQINASDLVVTMDSDGEDRPEDLPRLLSPLVADPSSSRKVVLALRTKRQTRILFKVLYFFFRIIFRLLTGTTVQTGNYAAYRGFFVKQVLTHPHFDLCYSSTFLSLNLPVELIPCERGLRYAGRSRMGYSRLLVHGLRMLMPFVDRIAIRALLLFSITFGLGIISVLTVVGVRLLTDAAIPGWATYTALAMIILSFVALGSFATLFAVFSQSRAISLTDLERTTPDGSARIASDTAD